MYKMSILLPFLMAFWACTNETLEMKEEMPQKSVTLNYLALGDSYTIGESVNEDERFPYQLFNSAFSVPVEKGEYRIIAKTGWTTKNLLDAMDEASLESGDYNFITLLIGVNNQYQGKAFEQYEAEFNELMERSIDLLSGDPTRLIVVSIPDYSVTPFAGNSNTSKIAEEIKQYNDYNEKVAIEMGAKYVYITDLTQNAKDDLSLLANDQLHPSAKSYGQWVQRILPELNAILSN